MVAMTGSYFRGDSEAVLSRRDEARFETGDLHLPRAAERLPLAQIARYRLFFYTGRYVEAVERCSTRR